MNFPSVIQVVKANMLYIEKSGISQKALNRLKRLAAFKNPEFYRAQAMRKSTYNQPRIISCAEETPEYLCLPRGCDVDLETLLGEAGVEIEWSDKTYPRKTHRGCLHRGIEGGSGIGRGGNAEA